MRIKTFTRAISKKNKQKEKRNIFIFYKNRTRAPAQIVRPGGLRVGSLLKNKIPFNIKMRAILTQGIIFISARLFCFSFPEPVLLALCAEFSVVLVLCGAADAVLSCHYALN